MCFCASYYYVEGPCEQQLIAALKEARKIDSREDKGIQCGAEFDSKVTDV